MTITFHLASPDEVAARWHEIVPILKRATDRSNGCYEPPDVLRQALNGQVAIQMTEETGVLIAVAVIERRQFPRKAVLDIPFLAGNRIEEWAKPFVAEMDMLAAKAGCPMISAWCARPGWVRLWESHGAKVKVAGSVILREPFGVTQ